MHDARPDEQDIASEAPSLALQPQRSRASDQHPGDRIRVRRELPAGDRQQRIEKGGAGVGHGPDYLRSTPARAKAACDCLPFIQTSLRATSPRSLSVTTSSMSTRAVNGLPFGSASDRTIVQSSTQ